MARQWAITVGVNQYQSLPALQYAKRDARLIRDFLARNAKFEQVYYFSDDSPDIVLDGVTFSTQPTFANLQRFLEVRFSSPFLNPDDTLWFFFSGHGLQCAQWDYLMPSDAIPDQAETTAFSIDFIAECLRRSGASNIVLFLDACRTEEQKFGQGFGTDPKEVVTIFSSDFNQISHEIDQLRQSPFAHALLEALRLQNKQSGIAIEHIYDYLRERVPELSMQYGKPVQIPRLSTSSTLAVGSVPALQDIPVGGQRIPIISSSGIKPLGGRSGNPLLIAQEQQARSRFFLKLVGLGVLLAGVIGYVVYQQSNQQPVASAPTQADTSSLTPQANSQSQNPAVKSTPVPANKAAGKAERRPANNLGQNSYKRIPKTGTYYAVSPQFSTSRREISSVSGRFCIKLVNGPPAKTTGYQQVTVSSVTLRSDGVYVDATQEKLAIDAVYAEFTDSKTVWQLLEDKVDRTGLVAECLTARDRYVRQVQGDLIPSSQ